MCEHHHHHEHEEHTAQNKYVKLRITLALALLVFAVFIADYRIKLAVYICAYLLSGFEIVVTALKNIKRGDIFDENFLMVTATLGAFAIKEYPEAVMVVILYRIGEYLQDRAIDKSKESVTELMNIRPDYVNLEQDGTTVKTSPEKVRVNDFIIVKTGEKIPLDGIVIEGQATIDTSAITGESVPRNLQNGADAISGCVVLNGFVRIKVSKTYHDSTVSRILELVEHAGAKKTTTEKFITKFARIYTPIVVFGALILATVPHFVFGGAFNVWVQRALTFLVISCPCALVLSIPLTFFAGIGGASKNGILIKGSKYLERLANPETVAFDKTGTLTRGIFSIQKICPQDGVSEQELLQTAAFAEAYSNHPIAISIKQVCDIKPDNNFVPEVEETAGKGIRVQTGNDIIYAGNSELMKDAGIDISAQKEYGTIVFVARNNRYLGYIVISDEIKPDSQAALKELKKLKIKTVMLSGDTKNNAEYIGKKLGIDKIYSELMPADKVQKIEEFINKKTKNKNVIFVGDGINDAPVLAIADTGISMGALGSDAAIEASDIVIMDDNLLKIPTAIKIAKKTLLIAKQNIVFAIGIKVLFLSLGALGYMSLWGAVFADVGVTLLAVLNSLRALKISTGENI